MEYLVKWKGYSSSENSWIEAQKMDFTPPTFESDIESDIESEISEIEEFSEDDLPFKTDPFQYCKKLINELKRKEKFLTRENQKLKKELKSFKKRKISK